MNRFRGDMENMKHAQTELLNMKILSPWGLYLCYKVEEEQISSRLRKHFETNKQCKTLCTVYTVLFRGTY